MLWEVEIRPRDGDPERGPRLRRVRPADPRPQAGADFIAGTARGYLLEGEPGPASQIASALARAAGGSARGAGPDRPR